MNWSVVPVISLEEIHFQLPYILPNGWEPGTPLWFALLKKKVAILGVR
ncbi:MAG: hypothetical protein ACYTXY_01860 [Nostoc sp.]